MDNPPPLCDNGDTRMNKDSEQGQISILLGMIMLTFIMFFTFVVNTGMLVNAKINLQNAADLAAYSGAAVQARQLNTISFLNYQMRREFKKFLFRYYVIGNMAQKSHPQAPGGGPRVWSPDGPPTNTNYGVPAVCVNFEATHNYCHIAALGGTVMPSANPLDATSGVLNAALTNIEQIRQNACKSIGLTNIQLLTFWLFNTDPDLTQIEAIINAAGPPNPPLKPGDLNPVDVLKNVRALAYGIGLIPRELILRSRIKTLNEYLNHKSEVLTKSLVDTMKKTEPDWPATERSVQAYLSAYHTLGNNIFDNSNDNITLTELLPGGSDGATMLQLKDTKAEFDTYAVDFELVVNSQGTKDCVAKLSPMTLLGMGVPVSVHKDPSILTYYALRLDATAKVMFSPWGDMKLKAYAAAQPFGSRIGPPLAWAQLASNLFTKPGASTIPPLCPAGKCVGSIPWLEVDQGASWSDQDVIYKMFEGFAPQLSGGPSGPIPTTLTFQDMERAYHVAMSPNTKEVGFFNIPGDPNLNAPDPMVNYFDTTGTMSAWAPIQSVTDQNAAGSAGNAANFISDMITQSMQVIQVGTNNNSTNTINADFAKNLKSGLEAYFTSLRTPGKGGEDGEGFNVVRLNDPFNTLSTSGSVQTINFPVLSAQALTKIKSSWNKPLDGELQAAGRTGYSVKFVPFQTLAKPGSVYSDGNSAQWTNFPAGDPVFDLDHEMLQH